VVPRSQKSLSFFAVIERVSKEERVLCVFFSISPSDTRWSPLLINHLPPLFSSVLRDLPATLDLCAFKQRPGSPS